MSYVSPFTFNNRITAPCMEIFELVDTLFPQSPLAKSPILHRKLRIKNMRMSENG